MYNTTKDKLLRFKRNRWILRVVNLFVLTGLILLMVHYWHHMPVWLIVMLSVLSLMILATGRAWCGYMCPVGFLLDVLWWISKKLHVRSLKRSDKFNRFIYWFKWFFLVFYTVLHFVLGIDPGWYLTVLLIVTAPFLVRFWCSFCPVGTLLGVFNKFSILRIKKEVSKCSSCASCSRACPMQSKRLFQQKQSGVNCAGACILCGDCITHCPHKGALKLDLLGKTLTES